MRMPKKRPLSIQNIQEQPLKNKRRQRKQKKRSRMAKKKNRMSSRLENHKDSSGPRLDPDERLLSRFYEPLILLHVLDRNGSQRISHCSSGDQVAPSTQLRELRRQFLDQLAYICDFSKGGDTVTAIALEACPSGVTYWIASNEGPCERVILFLHETLDLLKSSLLSTSQGYRETLELQIASRCISFNTKRVKAYQTLIQKPLKECLEMLSRWTEDNDKSLKNWLKGFQNSAEDQLDLCRFSYQERGCHFMRELQNRIGDTPAELGISESKRQAFSLVHHYIGRLGSHFKAARILAAAAWRMPDLFDGFSIKIRPSVKPPSLPPPIDRLTTLDGIIKRMLSKDSAEVRHYQEALAFMDMKFNILDRLLAMYKDKAFKPRVHAELILLEFFHVNRLPFIDDDRFIGCSKPACYCCYHYISAHPGGFVRPPSHGIRYLNWRPPDIVDTMNYSEKKHQRDVLNQMITQIRLDALRQIDQRRGPSKWRPDSTTGITYSLKVNDMESLYGTARRQEAVASAVATKDGKQSGRVGRTRYGHCDVVSNISTDDSDYSDSDGGVSLGI